MKTHKNVTRFLMSLACVISSSIMLTSFKSETPGHASIFIDRNLISNSWSDWKAFSQYDGLDFSVMCVPDEGRDVWYLKFRNRYNQNICFMNYYSTTSYGEKNVLGDGSPRIIDANTEEKGHSDVFIPNPELPCGSMVYITIDKVHFGAECP